MPDQGSAIIVVAMDLPLDQSGDRLFHRNAHRHDETADVFPSAMLDESRMDLVFGGIADAMQEAVLDEMLSSPAMSGRDGHHRQSLAGALHR